MKRFLINAMAFFIPGKSRRSQCRRLLRKAFSLPYIIKAIRQHRMNGFGFHAHAVRPKSILIVEPNPYHGEILPGFAKYFQDLQYDVDLFLRHENISDNPFCGTWDINIFPGTARHLKSLLRHPKIQEYDFVFLSSTAFWEADAFRGSYLDYLGFIPAARYGILAVEHNIVPCLQEYNEVPLLNEGRLFTLTGFRDTPALTPLYFMPTTAPQKNDVVNFIVVGAVSKSVKNHNLLLESVGELLKRGVKKFKVTVIGNGTFDVPARMAENILFLGRQSFHSLYQKLHDADFILPLLDPDEPDHRRYLDSTTTGSRQLTLGFIKPCVINDTFAKAYGFTRENAILYSGNDLVQGMTRAIDHLEYDYDAMRRSLAQFAESVFDVSLRTLKNSIDRIINA